MATVPGLPIQQGSAEAAVAKKARILLNDTGSIEGFRPVATPTDRFVNPARIKEDTKAQQLVQALGNIKQSAGRASMVYAENEREDADRIAQQDLDSMSFEEAKGLVDSGEIDETDNPYYRAAFMRQFGTRTAMERSRELNDYLLNDFNPEEDDFDEVVAEIAGRDTNGVTNEFFIKGYNDVFEQATSEMKDQVALRRAERRHRETRLGIRDSQLALIQQAQEAGLTPERIHQSIRATYKGNHKLLNVTPEQQDAILLETLGAYLENSNNPDDYEIIEELLTGNRGGPLPLVQQDGQLGAAAQRLLAAAETKRGELYREQTWERQQKNFWDAENGVLDEEAFTEYHESHPGVYTREQYFSYLNRSRQRKKDNEEAAARARLANQAAEFRMAQQGRFYDMFLSGDMHMLDREEDWMKDTGEADVITRSRIETQVVEQWYNEGPDGLTGRQRYQQARGLSDQELMAEEVRIFASNGITNGFKPRYEMEAGVNGLTFNDALDGELPEETLNGYRTYREYSNNHPNFTRQLLSSDTEEFYQLAKIFQETQGLSEEQALLMAHNGQVRMQGDSVPQAMQLRRDQMQSAIAGIDLDGLTSTYALGPEMDRLVEAYTITGVKPTQAKELAQEYFEERYIAYNGYPVPASLNGINEQTVPFVDTLLQTYFDTHEEEMRLNGIEDWKGLTIVPYDDAANTFLIAYGGSDLPMPALDLGENTFSIQDLRRMYTEEEQRVMAEAAEAASRGQAERQAMRDRNVDPDREQAPLPGFGGEVPYRP